MMQPRTFAAVRMMSLIALVGCGGTSSGTTGPGATANCGGASFLKATIDGAAWCSNAGVESTGIPQTLPGVYAITGTQLGGSNPTTLNITLYNVGAPGTYPLGVGPQVPGGNALVSNLSGGWVTAQTGADGSITITALTAARIEGSFFFTANATTGGATGAKAVTLGTFSLPVKPTGTIGPLPANAGSKVTATITGTSYTAAAASASISLANGIAVISSSNSVRGVSLTLSGFTGPGLYALASNPSRTITVINAANFQSNSWSSLGAGSSGSVVVASMTSARMQGTFSATLGPAPGTSTSGSIQINGQFDIGLLTPP